MIGQHTWSVTGYGSLILEQNHGHLVLNTNCAKAVRQQRFWFLIFSLPIVVVRVGSEFAWLEEFNTYKSDDSSIGYEWVLTSGWQLNVEQVIKNSKQRAVGLVN